MFQYFVAFLTLLIVKLRDNIQHLIEFWQIFNYVAPEGRFVVII